MNTKDELIQLKERTGFNWKKLSERGRMCFRNITKKSENIIAMGNVDPSSQFRNGTPESVKGKTMEIMEKVGSFRNYVPSSGCDIPPMSPWENIQAFFDGVNEHYVG